MARSGKVLLINRRRSTKKWPKMTRLDTRRSKLKPKNQLQKAKASLRLLKQQPPQSKREQRKNQKRRKMRRMKMKTPKRRTDFYN